jgi:hypothetical protein
MHEPKNRVYVRFVHLASGEFRVFVIFNAIGETPESTVRLEFHL